MSCVIVFSKYKNVEKYQFYLNLKIVISQEMEFKPNSTLQNRLIKWGLHLFINYWKASSLEYVRSPTHSLMPRLLNSCMGLYCLRVIR